MYPIHRQRVYSIIPLFCLLLAPFLTSCGSEEKRTRRANLHAEFIFRNHDEYFSIPPPPLTKARERYPWEDRYIGDLPRITKEFFRCKGSFLNPTAIKERPGKAPLYFRDCHKHGLPLRDQKEFVYPCLIELLNYVQEETEHRVIITTGHRCPEHNAYSDPSPYNWGSKHVLGAEVDFYVEGMEERPEEIIHLLMAYYSKNFPDNEKWSHFERYTREGLNVTTPPWYNQEVFIKLYLPDEGRDFDNQHPHPYIGVQVRYDREKKCRVRFEQEQAQNYLRR